MFLRNAPLLALSSGFITPATATPFQPTKDSAMKLSDTPNLVKPIFALNTSVLPVDSSGENTFNIRCDGETYGYNPNIVDCEGAKEYLLPDTTIWTWAERHTGLPNTVPLPYRIMGDRALCYIQATLIGDHRTAQASTNMLRQAGAALVLRCATNTVSQGGIATEIGKSDKTYRNRSFTRSHTGPQTLADTCRRRREPGRSTWNISHASFLSRNTRVMAFVQKRSLRHVRRQFTASIWSKQRSGRYARPSFQIRFM